MRIILTVALLTLGLSAYTFENKPRVDDINSSIQVLVNDVAFNSSTSKLTVTKVGGGSFDVDLSSLAGGAGNPIDSIALNDSIKKLIITKTDGSTSNVDVSALYDNVNVASGTLDTGSKSIKLTLNDASSTVVSVDMASIYTYISDVEKSTVDTLEYSNNVVRLKLNDGSEKVATIPDATPSVTGLLSSSDKNKLNKVFQFFSFSIADEDDARVTLVQVGGTILSGVNFARDKMMGHIIGDGSTYTLSASFEFHIKGLTGISLPNDGNTDIRVDLEQILNNTAESAGTTVIGSGGGSAIASCRSTSNSDLPPISLVSTVSPSGIRFYSPDSTNISDEGAISDVGSCVVTGTLITRVNRP